MDGFLLLHEKKLIYHKKKKELAIVEIRVWKIPKDKNYEEGIKYSLYLVHNGKVVVGFDNHKPKGHHLHIDGKEKKYTFTSNKKLLADFWQLVSNKGYEL